VRLPTPSPTRPAPRSRSMEIPKSCSPFLRALLLNGAANRFALFFFFFFFEVNQNGDAAPFTSLCLGVNYAFPARGFKFFFPSPARRLIQPALLQISIDLSAPAGLPVFRPQRQPCLFPNERQKNAFEHMLCSIPSSLP